MLRFSHGLSVLNCSIQILCAMSGLAIISLKFEPSPGFTAASREGTGRGMKRRSALTLGLVIAVFTGPTILTGLGKAERETLRDRWRRKHYPAEIERVTRLKAAISDLDRGGALLLA